MTLFSFCPVLALTKIFIRLAHFTINPPGAWRVYHERDQMVYRECNRTVCFKPKFVGVFLERILVESKSGTNGN